MIWTTAARDADLSKYLAEIPEAASERAVREKVEKRLKELWESKEPTRADSLALRVYGNLADAESLQQKGLVEKSEYDLYGQVTRLPEW